MEVRAAIAEDAADIALTRIAAWHHAYEDLVDPRLLMDLDLEDETATWRRRLEGPVGPDGLRTLVAVQGDRAIGFAAIRPRRREHDLPASTAELTALYVHPKAQGAGVGSLLLPAAEDAMRTAGATDAVLRVLAGNWWARSFYAARGWKQEEGAPPVDAGNAATERWGRSL